MAKDSSMFIPPPPRSLSWLKFSIVLSATLFALTIFAQTDSLEAKLYGSWVLTNHQIEAYTGESNLVTEELKLEYEFNEDGSYRLTSTSVFENKSTTVITLGQWYVEPEPLRIELYDNRFLPPHDKTGRCADHPVMLKRIEETEIAIEEFLFFEGEPGLSTYSKK